MKVLLVDESVAIRQSFGALLQTFPAVEVVDYAEDVASALASVASNPPDLIILDANLRVPDRGIDVLRYVRQHHSNIKTIVLSQSNGPFLRNIYMDAGALAYFFKDTEFQKARDFVIALANTRRWES